MENLNDRIKNLFLNMIKHPEKIVRVLNNVIEFDNSISIQYWNRAENEKDRNNEPLQLETHNLDFNLWDININVINHLVFVINTPYRQYKVPDLTDRIEYAQVLNTLDKALAEFERRKLSEYEAEFNYNPNPKEAIPF